STDAGPDEESYPLAPELPRHYLQSLLERLGYSIDGDAPRVDSNERRFSLFGLLACLGVFSVVLAIGPNLPLAIFAGLAGLAVVFGQIAISVLRVRWSLVHLAWW